MGRKVLFVDDEPRVLEGLQRMLRGMRQEWNMVFVRSAREALEALDGEPFDVVVSDMRMPEMDGTQLLAEVRRRHPEIVRIILSGYSDREMILRSASPAHQYLSKPCDAETLKSTVSRSCALRNLLADERLKRLVSQMDSLPSLPSLYMEIIEALRSSDASIQKIGEIISNDVGMTAKILQLVNSAFFGLCQHVSSPVQATSLLGLETIKALVLTVHIFSEFDRSVLGNLSLDRIWKHSMMTATLARSIAAEEKAKQSMIDDAFMAGLLHDSGKLVLAARLPGQYRQALDVARERSIPLGEAELEIFATTHAEVGAYLMGIWGLPDPIVEAIAFHHKPGQCCGNGFGPLTAVHVGNVLHQELDPLDGGKTAAKVDLDYLARLDRTHRLPTWRDLSQELTSGGETG